MGTTTKIDRDQIMIAALATGRTQEQAATLAGCSKSTVARRLRDPAVRDALAAERARLAAEVADALTGTVRASVGRLVSVLANGSDRDSVAAARVLLAEARAWRDAAWVDARVDELEAGLKAAESEVWG